MGKMARLSAKLKRQSEKRSRKEANKNKYAELSRQGLNGKRKISITAASTISHPCGNIGCLQCSEIAKLGKFNVLKNVVGPNKAHQMTYDS